MGQITSTYTVEVPGDVPPWGASARTDTPAGQSGVLELLVPWGASVAMAMVNESRTGLSIGAYAARYPGTTFLQIGFYVDRVVVDARSPAGDQRLLDKAVGTPEVVLGGIQLGVWLRVVRDGPRWGVQLLDPRGPAPYATSQLSVFDSGHALTVECAEVEWVGDGLTALQTPLQVWLQRETDQIHTITSGLTGSAEFTPSTYWAGTTSVVAEARQTTTSEATLELSGAATSYTSSDALPAGAGEGRTLTYSPPTISGVAEAATATSSKGLWMPPTAESRTTTDADAIADTSIVLGMPAFHGYASDGEAGGVDGSLPPVEVEAWFLPVTVMESNTGSVKAAIAPMISTGIYVKLMQTGLADLEMPPIYASASEGDAGAVSGRLAPLAGAAGVLEDWVTDSAAFVRERWSMRRATSMDLEDSLSASDTGQISPRTGLPSTGSVSDDYTWATDLRTSTDSAAEAVDLMVFATASPLAAGRVWCVNTETGASSRYEGYGFNSFFTHEGAYYGVADDGVYLLDGEADDGVQIKASLGVGATDFDSDRTKYVPKLYFGGTSGRAMHVEVDADGVVREYRARLHSADLGVHRVDCGVGVKANYWQFTIKNSEGADFAVDSFRATPVVIRRRV